MPRPVHALVGDDLFLQLAALREVVAAAPKDVQRTDFEGETVELADVLDELRSFAMFSSAKLVVVRDGSEFVSRFREKLEDYLQAPVAASTLVLRCDSLPANQRIYKIIQKIGQIHDCKAPKEVTNWIVKHAKSAHGLTLPFDAARKLEDLIGNDLGRLDNELAKLALQTDGPLNAESIAMGVAFQKEQEMWKLTDELGAGRTDAALQRWRQLMQMDSSTEFRAMTWLTLWLEKVRKALVMRKAGRRDDEIGRELRIWPQPVLAGFMKTAAALGESGAARLILRLADLDHRSKSGLGEIDKNVERFILEAARM